MEAGGERELAELAASLDQSPTTCFAPSCNKLWSRTPMPGHRRTRQPAQLGQRTTERRRGCKDRRPPIPRPLEDGGPARFTTDAECGREPVGTSTLFMLRHGATSALGRRTRTEAQWRGRSPRPTTVMRHHVGEADHPGPQRPRTGDNARCTRTDATVAAWSLPSFERHQADTDVAETLSDTLPRLLSLPGEMTLGSDGPAPEEATASRRLLRRSGRLACLQQMLSPCPGKMPRPPSSLPGERNSWLHFVACGRGQLDLARSPGLAIASWTRLSLL